MNAACATIRGRRVAMATICDQRRSCKAADIDRTLSCYAALSLQLLNLAAIPHAIGRLLRRYVNAVGFMADGIHCRWFIIIYIDTYTYTYTLRRTVVFATC